MPDTQRTLAALLTLFADNTSGDISPQDLRDFLVSVWSYSIELPAMAFEAVVGSPAKGISGGTRGSAWLLDAAADEEAVGATIPLPVGWRRAGTIAITALFSMVSATSGNVVLRLIADAYADGANLAAAALDESSGAIAVPGAVDTLKLHAFTGTITVDANDRMLQIRIGRDGNNASDTATGDLQFHGVLLEIT